ncbi:MAG TPA: TM2 domain-containing protein [Bacillota bacterium]|nr:TM2 domain-containing protein [Bacillota bacterium]HOH09942.1 TM2 domain-containing protein [Bacillota bacterium]HOY88260.1 TM2 domain-containing protein [Bacillota bacterium]HPI01590.1 TM2 domain-containing protein [Bacillota bacterium]HPM63361.1 TM2 domain-containing protein [Bacillota bacterium]
MKKVVVAILLVAMLLALPLTALASRTEDVNAFMASKGEWFDSTKTDAVKKQLSGLGDTAFKSAIAAEYRDPDTMLIWAILGIDRFFLDDIALGVLKVITAGGLGIWWIIDLINIKDRTHEYNYNLLFSFK